jgi:hypothetical protein
MQPSLIQARRFALPPANTGDVSIRVLVLVFAGNMHSPKHCKHERRNTYGHDEYPGGLETLRANAVYGTAGDDELTRLRSGLFQPDHAP